MKKLIFQWLIVPLLAVSVNNAAALYEEQVVHRTPREFKQAISQYIKHTDAHAVQKMRRDPDEDVSYKKELRYLFKNYGNFSAPALLSRLQSAHQTMVNMELDKESEIYQHYEQVSSALLLVCVQIFCNDVRNNMLDALHHIDHLIMYWRYQQQHQLSYFFHKSPTKWIMGKSQAKEITQNIGRLERKRRTLYTALGALMGHIHAFSECDVAYDNCYVWIHTLFDMMTCVQSEFVDAADDITFDALAAQLASKMKHVGSLKHTIIRSVAFAKPSSHVVRNWIPYTIALAAAGYAAHYHMNNPLVFPAAFGAVQLEAMRLFNLSIAPFNKIYERIKVALSDNGKVNKNDLNHFNEEKPQAIELKKDNFEEIITLLDQLKDVGNQLDEAGTEVVSNISLQLAKSNTTLREDAIKMLESGIEDAECSWIGYNFDAAVLKADLKKVQDKDPIAYQRVHKSITNLCKKTYYTPQGISLWLKLSRGLSLLGIVEDYLDPLQEYSRIADEGIIKKTVPLIDKEAAVIAKLGEGLIREGATQLQQVEILIKVAEEQLQQAEKQLKDQELTLMFTALIPLISTCAVTTKLYSWLSKKNYSPIRIALADINALLIESSAHLDDHDYGKLVYLISKLRHKSYSLKDPLAYEFLVDVEKLESKQYDPAIKRGIVENMFNKYAFLGRIVI